MEVVINNPDLQWRSQGEILEKVNRKGIAQAPVISLYSFFCSLNSYMNKLVKDELFSLVGAGDFDQNVLISAVLRVIEEWDKSLLKAPFVPLED